MSGQRVSVVSSLNRRSRSLVTGCCIVAASIAAAMDVGAQPVPFQLEFGTDRPITAKGGTGDEGRLLAESSNGDIIVAGYGAVYSTDIANDGESHLMLARFDRSGRLIWQRIYTDLPYDLMGLFSDRNGDFIALEKGRYSPRTPYTDVELRRIGADGDLSGIVQRIHAAFTDVGYAYADRGIRGLMFYGTTQSGLTRDDARFTPRSMIIMLSDGTVETKLPPVGFVVVQQLGDGSLLLFREKERIPYRRMTDRGIQVVGDERTGDVVAIGDFAGNVDEIFDRDTDEVFFYSNAFATADAIFLLRQLYVDGIRRGVVSTYSRAGVLLAESGAAGGDRLAAPSATADGGLAAVGRDPANGQALLFEFSAQGDLRWSAGFNTAGGGNYIRDTIVLSDGWFAVTGATWQDTWNSLVGRWSGEGTGRDRDAFILVTERSLAGLAAASYQGRDE